MPEMMRRSAKPCLSCIVLHALLDPADGQWHASTRTFLDQEDMVGLRFGPYLQICHECIHTVLAYVDNAPLVSFACIDQDLSSPEVNGIQCQVGYLCYAQSTSEHEHEDGFVSRFMYDAKKSIELFILQMLRQGLRQAQTQALPDRVVHLQALLPD